MKKISTVAVFLVMFMVVRGQDLDLLTMRNLYGTAVNAFKDTLRGSQKVSVNGQAIYLVRFGYKEGTAQLVQESPANYYYAEIIGSKPERFDLTIKNMIRNLASVGTGVWRRTDFDSNMTVFAEDQSGISIGLFRFTQKKQSPVPYKSPEKGIGMRIMRGRPVTSGAMIYPVLVDWCAVTALIVKEAASDFTAYATANNKVQGYNEPVYKVESMTYLEGVPGNITGKADSPGKYLFYQTASRYAEDFNVIRVRMESCLSVDPTGNWNKITSKTDAVTWTNTAMKCMVMIYTGKSGVSIVIQSFK
jgi:hypothetical protein